MVKDKESEAPLLGSVELTEDEDAIETSNVNDDARASISSIKPVLSEFEEESNDMEGNQNVQEEEGENYLISKYHTACQQGDLQTVRELLDNNVIAIEDDFDRDNITGLHWASVNNRLNVVKYLISKGADVNAKGGNLHATPLHWAASHGYVYIVDYLLKHGADATITDDQGFNLLHLSVNSSNIMLVIYVLFFVVDKGIIDINCLDPNGRSAILWAAYQGDSLTVNKLIEFHANCKIVDKDGFSPLHWGIVKGQIHVLKYLINENGNNDFFLKTNDGKDCFTISKEMNTEKNFTEALRSLGYDKYGYPIKKFFKKDLDAKRFTFFLPWIIIGSSLQLAHIESIPIIFKFLIIMIEIYISGIILKKWVLPCFKRVKIESINLIKSPLLSGIYSGSIIWMLIYWLIKILPNIWDEEELLINNLIFLICVIIVIYQLKRLIENDPGIKKEDKDHDKIRENIIKLLKIGKFDINNYCIESNIRKPIRSKFSYLNYGIINKFDHYCPWVYNDIGIKNHKRFIYFILATLLGIINYLIILIEYFDEIDNNNYDEQEDKENNKCLLVITNKTLCKGIRNDKSLSLLGVWILFQLIWVTCLSIVQLTQISIGVTTYEFNKIMKRLKRRQDDLENTIRNNDVFNTIPEDYIIEEEEGIKGDEDLEIDNTESTGMKWGEGNKIIKVLLLITGIGQIFKIIGNFQKFSTIKSNYGFSTNLKDFFLLSDKTAPFWQRLLYSNDAEGDNNGLLNNKEVNYDELYILPERQ